MVRAHGLGAAPDAVPHFRPLPSHQRYFLGGGGALKSSLEAEMLSPHFQSIILYLILGDFTQTLLNFEAVYTFIYLWTGFFTCY